MPLWLGHSQAGQKDPACRLWSGRQYNRCCFNTQLGPACSAVCPADAEDKWSKAFSPEKSPVNAELISLTDISALSVEARLLRPSWDTLVEQRDGWMASHTSLKGTGVQAGGGSGTTPAGSLLHRQSLGIWIRATNLTSRVVTAHKALFWCSLRCCGLCSYVLHFGSP